MNQTDIKENKRAQTTYHVVRRGIHSLFREIGPKGTMDFFHFFYQGSGDSVKEFKQMWQNMSLNEIHKDILQAKKEGII